MRPIVGQDEFDLFSEEALELFKKHGVSKEDLNAASVALAKALEGGVEDVIKFGLDNKEDPALNVILTMMAFGASTFLMSLAAQQGMPGGGCGGNCKCGDGSSTVH